MQPLHDDIVDICNNIKDVSKLFEGKTVLITGGGGFLGQYICATFALLNQKYLDIPCKVIVIDNFITSNKKSFEYENFTYLEQDVNIYPKINKLDYIIFLAGIASPYYYRKYPLQTIDIVSVGLKNYLDLAKEHNAKLLFASSSEIYGNPDKNNIPTKEIYNGNVSTLSDRSCYDESKRLGETLCYIYSQQSVHTTIVRPFNFFGPLMMPTDYRVLPNFAHNILNDNPVQLYGDGQQTRTFCYVSDGISGILLTLMRGLSSHPYNIGNTNPEISMNNLYDMCVDICNKEKITHFHPNKEMVAIPKDYPIDGDPSRRCPDITKAKQDLQYLPKISLVCGLTKFLKWAGISYIKR